MGRRLKDGTRVIVSSHALQRLAERKHLYIQGLRKYDLLDLVQRGWDAAADAVKFGNGYLIIEETAANEVTVVTYSPSVRKDDIVA